MDTILYGKLMKKLDKPPHNGNNGQVLTTNGDGTTEWTNPIEPSDEQVQESIMDYLDEHPEAVSSVRPLPAKNFVRVGCIGDSYTAGYIQVSGSDTGNYGICSWPYYMEKLTGQIWTNFGSSGSGAKTWVNETSGFNMMDAVREPGNKCQAYIIGLMLNDCKPGLTAYTPVGTAEDIGTETESYYSYYYRLIQKVHPINPDAPIFCLTCPGTDTKLAPYNVALREIVTYCRNENLPVYLCDLASETYNNSRYYKHPIFQRDYVRGHYTGLGYEMMAEIFLRVLSDVMLEYYTSFRTIHRIDYDDPSVITDHEIRITKLELGSNPTPEMLRKVVSTGKANEYFSVGDVINIPWTNRYSSPAVQYDMPFKVVKIGDVYDSNDFLHRNGLWLECQYAVPQQIIFDQPEIIKETAETFQSGYYYYLKDGSDYIEQTVIPGETIPSDASYYKHYRSGMSERIRYGSDDWSQSAVRQWLNSNKGKNQWWTAQHQSDVAPWQLSTVPGFMSGFSEAWQALFKPVRVQTALNTTCDGGATVVTYDKFFLPSADELYGVSETPNVEGDYFPYWKQATGYDEPTNGDSTHQNDARKIPKLDALDSGGVTIWARSVKLDSTYRPYLIGSVGYLQASDRANHAFYTIPCCVLY